MDSADYRGHDEHCVYERMVVTFDRALPIDDDPNRVRVRIGDLDAPGDPAEVIAEGEILDLTPYNREGLHQRQGGFLVPITIKTYSENVERCDRGDCTLCKQCRAEAEYFEDRSRSLETLDEAVAKAEAAVTNALHLFRAEAEITDATDYELNSVESADGVRLLEQADLLTRAAKRITQGVLDRVHALTCSDTDEGGEADA